MRPVSNGIESVRAFELPSGIRADGKCAPTPETALVKWRSSLQNLFYQVYVNGQFRGTTPVNLHLAAGTHKVELRLAGYRGWERELVVVAGDDTRVAATLQPE